MKKLIQILFFSILIIGCRKELTVEKPWIIGEMENGYIASENLKSKLIWDCHYGIPIRPISGVKEGDSVMMCQFERIFWTDTLPIVISHGTELPIKKVYQEWEVSYRAGIPNYTTGIEFRFNNYPPNISGTLLQLPTTNSGTIKFK